MRLGVYPEISLKEAREKREELRGLIAKGIAPARQSTEAGRAAKKHI
ncbi:Arm DNA-binding domain-containing protein [Neisseria mucosa]|nr:Arm DNA-binding domain-containing protein [Neisseria mucosa]